MRWIPLRVPKGQNSCPVFKFLIYVSLQCQLCQSNLIHEQTAKLKSISNSLALVRCIQATHQVPVNIASQLVLKADLANWEKRSYLPLSICANVIIPARRRCIRVMFLLTVAKQVQQKDVKYCPILQLIMPPALSTCHYGQ